MGVATAFGTAAAVALKRVAGAVSVSTAAQRASMAVVECSGLFLCKTDGAATIRIPQNSDREIAHSREFSPKHSQTAKEVSRVASLTWVSGVN